MPWPRACAARERLLLERRAAALRETLGFLAHEVSTPLATVRGYLTAMRDRHAAAPPDEDAVAHLAQRRPGEVLHLIEAAQRRADYAQSLVATFVQSARDAWQPDASVRLRASELVGALRDEYPFEGDEAHWLQCDLAADFSLPGRRDLLYLVLCTLVKNALLALRPQPRPCPACALCSNARPRCPVCRRSRPSPSSTTALASRPRCWPA